MAEKDDEAEAGLNDPTDIRYYLHHPHDKYVRAILQHRTAALELIQFALDETLREYIDPESLQLGNNSFIDEKLKISLADICYEGFSRKGERLRVCLLFEHKSEMPARGLYEQLNRYINNIWLEDQKQDRPPTLSIPILIYHGSSPIHKERPATLFPQAPPELLRFVPLFDYVMLDISALSEEAIEQLGPSALRHVFLALKFSRNEAYLQQNWKKVLIFAQVFHHDTNTQSIIKYTLLYMTSVSKTIQEKFENPAENMSVQEEELVLPYVFLKYQRKYEEEGLQKGMEKGLQEGLEKGLEKGLAEGRAKGREEGRMEGETEGMLRVIHNFIKHHPELSDEALAASFEVDIALIKTARAL